MTSFYCVKEKKSVDVANPTPVTMKNGRPAMTATCPSCGTKMFRIGSK